MNLPARIESLRSRHALLDGRINSEDSRPAPDQGMLTRLKREKLLIKEEMERLRARL